MKLAILFLLILPFGSIQPVDDNPAWTQEVKTILTDAKTNNERVCIYLRPVSIGDSGSYTSTVTGFVEQVSDQALKIRRRRDAKEDSNSVDYVQLDMIYRIRVFLN